MNHRIALPLFACAVAVLGGVVSCAGLKPVARSTHDIAKELCSVFYGEKNGISIEEAGRAFCETERQLRPWLDEVLKAQQRAGAAREAEGSK